MDRRLKFAPRRMLQSINRLSNYRWHHVHTSIPIDFQRPCTVIDVKRERWRFDVELVHILCRAERLKIIGTSSKAVRSNRSMRRVDQRSLYATNSRDPFILGQQSSLYRFVIKSDFYYTLPRFDKYRNENKNMGRDGCI